MKSNFALLAAAALAGLSVAQNNTTLTIDPNSVDLGERLKWCKGQTNTCTAVCGGPGETKLNRCDEENLTYECTCSDDSAAPVGEYTDSLPFYICKASIAQCIEQHPDDREGQDECLSTQCGSKNATELTASATTAAPSETGTPTETGAPSGTSGAAEAASSTGAAVLQFAQSYGTSALAAGIFALFGLAL